MKKGTLFLFNVLLLVEPLLSADSYLLPNVLKQDELFRPYVRDVVCTTTKKDHTTLTAMESDNLFKTLDFDPMLEALSLLSNSIWRPHHWESNSPTLKKCLEPYLLKTDHSENIMIFSANVLYLAGEKMYEQTENPIHLEQAASIGHDIAQYKMFFIDYKLGKLSEAKNYIFCSAAQGNADALLLISEIYYGFWNIDTPKDISQAYLFCQEAANLGHAEAIFRTKVSTLIEGLFKQQINFQEGIREAKKLAEEGNEPATKFIESILHTSGDALQEGNEMITSDDLIFLKDFLNWEDE